MERRLLLDEQARAREIERRYRGGYYYYVLYLGFGRTRRRARKPRKRRYLRVARDATRRLVGAAARVLAGPIKKSPDVDVLFSLFFLSNNNYYYY